MGSKRKVVLRPSLLERLVDWEPEKSVDPPEAMELQVEEFEASVFRDVQDLLSARQVMRDQELVGLPHALGSLVTYGLPDLASLDPCSGAVHERLRAALESALRRFEPRLSNISAQVIEFDGSEREVHFRLRATLRVEPKPRPVEFDTLLRLERQTHQVKKNT